MWKQVNPNRKEDIDDYFAKLPKVRVVYENMPKKKRDRLIDKYTDPDFEAEGWQYKGQSFEIGMIMLYRQEVGMYFLHNYWVEGASKDDEQILRLSIEKAIDYMRRHDAQFHNGVSQKMVVRWQRDTKGDSLMFFRIDKGVPESVLNIFRSYFKYVHVVVESGKYNDVIVGLEKDD